MREFRQIKVDSKTYGQISHIARVLGKSKAQVVREVAEPIFEECERNEKAVLKVMRNPMRNMVIFEVIASETYVRPKLKGEKQ